MLGLTVIFVILTLVQKINLYRRLQWSPDGLLLAVPAGRVEPEQGKVDIKPINAVYIYTRYSLKV